MQELAKSKNCIVVTDSSLKLFQNFEYNYFHMVLQTELTELGSCFQIRKLSHKVFLKGPRKKAGKH